MSWILTFLALGYCLYRFFILHFVETWGNFGTPEWLMLVVAILMVPIMVYCAFRAVKSYRATKARQEEEMQKYRDQLALRKQRMFMEEDDEISPPVAEQEDDDWEPGDGLEENEEESGDDDDDWEPGDSLEEEGGNTALD